jgi:hypothetical protein
VQGRPALEPHEPYPTLAAKVGARWGQGSLDCKGEHASPGKSGQGVSLFDGARSKRAHNPAGITIVNTLTQRDDISGGGWSDSRKGALERQRLE